MKGLFNLIKVRFHHLNVDPVGGCLIRPHAPIVAGDLPLAGTAHRNKTGRDNDREPASRVHGPISTS